MIQFKAASAVLAFIALLAFQVVTPAYFLPPDAEIEMDYQAHLAGHDRFQKHETARPVGQPEPCCDAGSVVDLTEGDVDRDPIGEPGAASLGPAGPMDHVDDLPG